MGTITLTQMMKLVPFSGEYLRLDEALPFGVRDAMGRLLLAAGQRLTDETHLEHLRGQALTCDESESAAWHRRLKAEVDQMIRRNESLKSIATARPTATGRDQGQDLAQAMGDRLESIASQLEQLLLENRPDDGWPDRLRALLERLRELTGRRFDAALYSLVYTASHVSERYSSHHALLCAAITEQAAEVLGWPDAERDSLALAALAMNIAMVRLQNLLAITGHTPTAEMRQAIADHAERGVARLQQHGLTDRLALEVVRRHHDAGDEPAALAAAPPPQRLASLLRRVDIFAAKISRRATREPMSPVRAAREACLGTSGQPDEIGAALLRAVGLYPPGSFVELVSGEIGIVVARGPRANVPLVASLVAASGLPLGEPAMRNTREPRFGVRAAVAIGQVRVHPPHERVLALA